MPLASGSGLNALAQHQAQLLKTGQIATAHLLAHLLGGAPQSQPQGVARTDQAQALALIGRGRLKKVSS
jgi:hypothetical protein